MKIVPFVVKNVIAPHGMTDLTHSMLTDRVPQLMTINAMTIIGSKLITIFNQNILLNIIFVLSSIIHFRKDFPKIKINYITIPNWVLCSVFLLSCVFTPYKINSDFGANMFLYYITFIHVPNHYRVNWKYIKKNIPLNIFLLTSSPILFNLILKYFKINVAGNNFINLMKSLIISHIIYDELYVADKYRLQ
jgi:hypothetical protein